MQKIDINSERIIIEDHICYSDNNCIKGMLNNPDTDAKAVHKLNVALSMNGFSIYSRIIAATNLVEALAGIQDRTGKNIMSIHPEDIYIYTDNGDIYIWIEQWLNDFEDTSTVVDFGFSPEWYERDDKNITEEDLRFFI